MKTLARYCLLLVATLGLAVSVPHLYRYAFSQKPVSPILFYSAVRDDLMISTTVDDERQYRDMHGNTYSAREYRQQLPFLFARDLINWHQLPPVIGGEAVTPEQIQRARDFVTLTPRDVDQARQQLGLYPLFEASGEFSNLTLPDDLFRLTDGITFINGRTNQVDPDKSGRFTAALKRAGFTPPARLIAGNPNPKKPYDAGYFIVDHAGHLFQMRQIHGEPRIEALPLAADTDIRWMMVRENADLPYDLWVFTGDGGIHQLMKDTHQLQRLPVPAFDPDTQELRYLRDPLNHTLRISDGNDESVYVLDRQFHPVHTWHLTSEPALRGWRADRYEQLFAMVATARIDTRLASGAYLTPSPQWRTALLLSGVLGLMVALWRRYRRHRHWLLDGLLVAAGGVLALIALSLIRDEAPPAARTVTPSPDAS